MIGIATHDMMRKSNHFCLSHGITGYVPLILQAYLLDGGDNPHVTELWQW